MSFKVWLGKIIPYRGNRGGRKKRCESAPIPTPTQFLSYPTGIQTDILAQNVPVWPSLKESSLEDGDTLNNITTFVQQQDDSCSEEDSKPKRKTKLKKHARFYIRGKKQSYPLNIEPVQDEEEKTVFIKDEISSSALQHTSIIDSIGHLRNPHRFYKYASTTVDVDLTIKLKTFAAFQPRDTRLLLTLKNRGIKYLSEFDLEQYTSTEVYNMLIKSVGEAMIISQEEEDVRKLLRLRAVNRDINKHNEFVKKGKLKFGCFPIPWFSRKIPVTKVT